MKIPPFAFPFLTFLINLVQSSSTTYSLSLLPSVNTTFSHSPQCLLSAQAYPHFSPRTSPPASPSLALNNIRVFSLTHQVLLV